MTNVALGDSTLAIPSERDVKCQAPKLEKIATRLILSQGHVKHHNGKSSDSKREGWQKVTRYAMRR